MLQSGIVNIGNHDDKPCGTPYYQANTELSLLNQGIIPH